MSGMYKVVERGSRGATYQKGWNTWTVYEIGTYPRSSVLAGQQQRIFIGDYPSKESALAEHPDAEEVGDTYREPYLEHLPDDGDY